MSEVRFPGLILGPKTLLTPAGGFATKLWNKTGATILHGTAVSASIDDDYSIRPQDVEFDCVGFAYGDIPDNTEGWVVTSGVAQALLENGTAGTRGYWCKAAPTNGRIVTTTPPSGLGALTTAEHFKEVGHCIESVSAGTDKLVYLLLHFL